MQKETQTEKKETLQNRNSFPLIDGSFTADEAANVLFSMIGSKIAFHQLQGFGQEIRMGKGPAHSEQRIRELMSMKEEIRQLIQQAREQGRQLRIRSLIEITPTEDSMTPSSTI